MPLMMCPNQFINHFNSIQRRRRHYETRNEFNGNHSTRVYKEKLNVIKNSFITETCHNSLLSHVQKYPSYQFLKSVILSFYSNYICFVRN